MSLASDPLDQAFPADSSASGAVAGDPLDAAFPENKSRSATLIGKKGEVTSGPLGFINGLAELAGNTLLNIPSNAVHGAVDLYRRATGGDPNAPDIPSNAMHGAVDLYRQVTGGDRNAPVPSLESALHVPLSPNAQSVGQSVGDAVSAAAEPYRVRAAEPFLNDYVAPVLGDVGAVAPVAPVVGKIAGAPVLARTAGRVSDAVVDQFRAPVRAPEKPVLSAQEVVDQEASKRSGGAAAVGINTDSFTPETQAEIQRAGAEGKPLNSTALERHYVAESLPIPQRLTRGMATGDGPLISEEINSRRTNPEIGAHLDNLNQGLIDNLDELRRESAPQAVGNNRIQNDQGLVDSLKDIHLQRKAAWKQEYDAAEQANGGPVQLDGSAALSAADAALAKQSRYKLLPQSVQGVMDEIRANNGQMSLDDLEGYRTTLAKAARAAERSPDGGNVSYAISLARDAIEKNVQMQPGASTVAKQHYDTARGLVAADYAERRVNPAYDAAVNDLSVTPRGERSDLSGKFGDKYIIGGTSANLQRLRALYGEDTAAQQTMTSVALNHLRESAGIKPEDITGNFSQHGYNSAWSYDIAPRAKELLQDPQLIEHAQNIGRVADWENPRGKSTYIGRSNTATMERTPTGAAVEAGAGHLVNAATELLPAPGRVAVKVGKAYFGAKSDAAAAALAESQRQAFIHETLKPGAGLTYQAPQAPRLGGAP